MDQFCNEECYESLNPISRFIVSVHCGEVEIYGCNHSMAENIFSEFGIHELLEDNWFSDEGFYYGYGSIFKEIWGEYVDGVYTGWDEVRYYLSDTFRIKKITWKQVYKIWEMWESRRMREYLCYFACGGHKQSIVAKNAHEAAVKFIRSKNGDMRNDNSDEVDVCVQRKECEEVRTYVVHIEYEPHFYAVDKASD